MQNKVQPESPKGTDYLKGLVVDGSTALQWIGYVPYSMIICVKFIKTTNQYTSVS